MAGKAESKVALEIDLYAVTWCWKGKVNWYLILQVISYGSSSAMVEKWKQLSCLLNPNRIGVGDVMFIDDEENIEKQ